MSEFSILKNSIFSNSSSKKSPKTIGAISKQKWPNLTWVTTISTETLIYGEKWLILNRFLIEFTRKVICFTRLIIRNSTWRATTMCDLIKITNFGKKWLFFYNFIKITGFIKKKHKNNIFLVQPTRFFMVWKRKKYILLMINFIPFIFIISKS